MRDYEPDEIAEGMERIEQFLAWHRNFEENLEKDGHLFGLKETPPESSSITIPG